MTEITKSYSHIFGVALVVLNAVLAAIAGDPVQYGITTPFVGAWLALVVLAIGMILKELPSESQTAHITNLKTQVSGLGGTVRGKKPEEKS